MTTPIPSDPIDALYGEHDEALRHLDLLGGAGRSLASGGGPSALADFERAVSFLDSEIRAHNEWEEVNLFPRLEAYMGPGGPCMIMRAEHRQLWDLYGALGPLLAAAREGRADGEDLRNLAQVGASIVDLLSNHIEKENQILFPMARRMLSPKDLIALAAARPAAG